MSRTITVIALLSLIVAPVVCTNCGGALPQGTMADRIIVEKSIRRLTLMRDNAKLKSYKIALGRSPTGDKQREGDNRTPEGIYIIDRRNARSQFYRALHISYPTPNQIEKARKAGVALGGNILVHGLPPATAWIGSGHTFIDWTAGCIAVTNSEIDEIWRVVPDRTIIEIRP